MALKTATILKTGPVVTCIAEMAIRHEGVFDMLEWVRSRRPECVPEEYATRLEDSRMEQLLPHPWLENGRNLTSNEVLVEVAGRKCYDSWGLKAGRKTNAEYIANTQAGEIPHASIMYHAKMTFFIAGVSRRVSHELIRHYVGADRTEEGSPSQESTRYVEHAGYYIAHPAILEDPEELDCFASAMGRNYAEYRDYISRRETQYLRVYGNKPTGMDRKRIFESASPYLSHACETSFVWTTNPIALAKMLKERDNEGADLEYRRLAQVWKKVCLERWPNLFCQPWMQDEASTGGLGVKP
jgi:thymidylate synthase (FAD)